MKWKTVENAPTGLEHGWIQVLSELMEQTEQNSNHICDTLQRAEGVACNLILCKGCLVMLHYKAESGA